MPLFLNSLLSRVWSTSNSHPRSMEKIPRLAVYPPHIPTWGLLFICSVMSNSLRPHELQHARLPCPSPSPRACSNSCPLSRWCHLTISFSVTPFSSCLQSFPASGSFPVNQFFASGGQRAQLLFPYPHLPHPSTQSAQSPHILTPAGQSVNTQ